jgi:xanthine/CO dehydrogenase XdhC/CoxF family maturation factor
VTVHDHRPAYLTEQRFPDAGELVLQVVDEPVYLAVDDRTAVVIMTHNYTRDRTILPTALRSNACYVGMLGPKSRTEQLIADLNNAGERFTPVQLVKLYAPVGLDIGATTPEGIALSIVGEIQSIFAKRDGGNLRDRIGSIYDRK